MVMLHENDEAAGGCQFARFFETTPQVTPRNKPGPKPEAALSSTPSLTLSKQDLIVDGLYKALAYAWFPEPFRAVSVALVAQAFWWILTLNLMPSPYPYSTPKLSPQL